MSASLIWGLQHIHCLMSTGRLGGSGVRQVNQCLDVNGGILDQSKKSVLRKFTSC